MPANRNISDETPILLGTGNPSKQAALRWLLDGLPLNLTTPSQLGLADAPDERGDTHYEIAKAKALDWSRSGSMLTIATDGGLVLPALGDAWESRYTHRFAGPKATNLQRLERLLQLMKPFHGEQRRATWVEAMAIADRGELLASWELNGATGVIADKAATVPESEGFWAFSVWYFPDLGKTYDQLSQELREEIDDHWAQLRAKVREFFTHHWRTGP
ncbi:MAG: hypothetical protein BZY81_01775 [SAR202 cluster bacterium Io17-Chloro-G4]|nr:MAG: hypothetical protein BZY81_01775 [SAR202 cluster bacterium Io17-Chloro-G4]